ncbi:MAG: metallophosphoesterase [Desulfuromonas sp.]|nr:MAG: metallophosphoesterase [Desulfuromonas sp.]
MTRRQLLKYGLRGTVLVTAGTAYANTWSGQIELTRPTLTIPSLPRQFHGLRIGHLSDLHASLIVSRDHIASAAQLLMREKPDLIVLTGDFISGATKTISGDMGAFDASYLERCVEGLSALSAPLGIYAVLGNHDFWSGPRAVEAICQRFREQLGVVWLRNESRALEKAGKKIHLLGVDDYWEASSSLHAAKQDVLPDEVSILLSHNPDINEEIDLGKTKIDLVLSGHTHGGQVVLPFVGQPFLPSGFGQKYRAGLVRDGARQTYVTRGVGHLLAPLRLNCPPEVTLLTLV